MENPKIEWVNKSGRQCLKFTFTGKFNEVDVKPALDKWRQYFSSKSGEKITLIWDCLNMEDYDHEARSLWQKGCKDMKDQIEIIWVITNSLLIKMGASVVSVFTSLKLKVVGSEDEIQIS